MGLFFCYFFFGPSKKKVEKIGKMAKMAIFTIFYGKCDFEEIAFFVIFSQFERFSNFARNEKKRENDSKMGTQGPFSKPRADATV
jgi:hypothetical protein